MTAPTAKTSTETIAFPTVCKWIQRAASIAALSSSYVARSGRSHARTVIRLVGALPRRVIANRCSMLDGIVNRLLTLNRVVLVQVTLVLVWRDDFFIGHRGINRYPLAFRDVLVTHPCLGSSSNNSGSAGAGTGMTLSSVAPL